ncbi:MAG TPA: ERAP1-like C-terminal domain-containing protein, partial [Kofleriaceae bacterium]|nr:ERAP1-like C-terminal domain-containing protein [Kofleriaceae bacterium]
GRLVDGGWRDLPQPMRGVALAVAADARPDLFDRLLRDLRAEPDRARREELYRALAGVRDAGRQKTALGLLLDPKLDLRESIWMLFGGTTDANLAVAQQFFRDHKDALVKRLPSAETTNPLARLSRLFTATCRADQRDAVADYVTKTFASLPGGARIVRQAIEAMDQCIASRALLEPDLKAWLEGLRVPKPAAAAAPAPKPARAAKPARAGAPKPARAAKPAR